jgi:hypothetical protein
VKDIEPIILIGTTGLVVSVHPQVAATSIKALIAQAKASPGKLNYASVGAGSVAHLGFELFKQMSGANIVHVPYKGGGPALGAVVAGEVGHVDQPFRPSPTSGRGDYAPSASPLPSVRRCCPTCRRSARRCRATR